MKKILSTFFIFFLLSFKLMAHEIVCNFDIDKKYEAKSGKFKKGKVSSSQKNHEIKITKLSKISDRNFNGTLNGAGHHNRNVIIVFRDKVVSISQSDATNPDYFAHYTIFMDYKNTSGDFLSSMYEVYPSYHKHGAVFYYRGSCKGIK